ncbi:MAG: hypothetical protein R3192_12560 [Woeseiaceae bacterium]|nr:hypothetical protein [Woeseiaceae bacterium]
MTFNKTVLALTGLVIAGCGGSGSGPAPAAVNQAPTISAIPDQATMANQQSSAIGFTVTDEQTSALSITASSENQDVVTDQAIELGGSGANRTVRITPVIDTLGDSFITIFATDSQGLTASSSFLLTIEPQMLSMQQFVRDAFAKDADGEPGSVNAIDFQQDADGDDFADLLAQ